MTKKQKQERILYFNHLLTSNGFIIDTWGNYKKNDYRIKFMKVNIRVEKGKPGNWFKLYSLPIVSDKIVEVLNSVVKR